MTRNFEIDGCTALGFDTGLDARAFAQAKIAQFITEPGLIVRPAEAPHNRVGLWKASGVRELTGVDGKPTMVVWGPPVDGERLDTLLAALPDGPDGNEQQDKALAAVSLWIQAILSLGENPYGENFPGKTPQVPLWPCAAIIMQGDEGRPPAVFFAPPSLARRSVTTNDERYVNPALARGGAFTAAAMLYRIFAGTPPFSADDLSLLHQDMQDGNFLPPHLAVPGLEPRLTALLQNGLGPVNNGAEPAPVCGLDEILAVITTGGQTVSTASLVAPLPEPDRLLLEKEKAQFLKIKTASIKTRRFVARNMALLLGILAAAVAAIFIVYSMIDARAHSPTTAGMEPVQVIESYYHGFGELDHQMMEACVTSGAGKGDITAVINLFVVNKTRQAYERNTQPMVFPAHQWQGGALPDTPLFGATDLRVEWLGGDESGDEFYYRVNYTFWIPAQADGEAAGEPGTVESPLSLSYPRRDLVTLVRKKGNWRIADIVRE